MTTNIGDIDKLVQLFSLANNNNNEEENETEANCENTSSENLRQTEAVKCQDSSRTTPKSSPYAKLTPVERREVLDPEEAYFDDGNATETAKSDWKKTPKWDISYRQSVSASDMFLGMGFKTASTSSCENMIVQINLPGEKLQNIDLKIEKVRLCLTSPNFYLDLTLPHPVDPKTGDAQFDKEQDKLVVTLIMDRELDLLNF